MRKLAMVKYASKLLSLDSSCRSCPMMIVFEENIL